MSEENITLSTFKIWTESQDRMINAFISEMKEVKKEQQQTNQLLRDDINTTKAALNQHIVEYTALKTDNDKKFNKIFNVLRSREGVYNAAKWVKIGLGILLAGALTAAGASLWNNYTVQEKPKTEVKP